MSGKLDIRIETADVVEYAIRDSVGDGNVQLVSFTAFEHEDHMHRGMMVTMAPVEFVIHELINDEHVVETCWTDHPTLGQCMATTRQCPMHADNPLDRHTIYFTNVRPGRKARCE